MKIPYDILLTICDCISDRNIRDQIVKSFGCDFESFYYYGNRRRPLPRWTRTFVPFKYFPKTPFFYSRKTWYSELSLPINEVKMYHISLMYHPASLAFIREMVRLKRNGLSKKILFDKFFACVDW